MGVRFRPRIFPSLLLTCHMETFIDTVMECSLDYISALLKCHLDMVIKPVMIRLGQDFFSPDLLIRFLIHYEINGGAFSSRLSSVPELTLGGEEYRCG